jgi:hypothetical protein
MANLQSTNVVGALCVNGVAIGGGKDFKYCCFTGSTNWTPPSSLVTGDGVVDALLVGGGGGGGGINRPTACQCCLTGMGGGGGGGIISSLLTMTSSNDACTITIGAGGAGGVDDGDILSTGQVGGNTIFGNSGSGSDSSIAFGGGAGAADTDSLCNVFGTSCTGSTLLRGGGGGCSTLTPKYASRIMGGYGGSSLSGVKISGPCATGIAGVTSVGNTHFIQGFRGGITTSECNINLMGGESLKGYGQSYYVNPTDPTISGSATIVSGSSGWGAGGQGGGSYSTGQIDLGGGAGGQNFSGSSATGCGGGGGGAGRTQGPGCYKYVGGDGAPGIMIIKWQQ